MNVIKQYLVKKCKLLKLKSLSPYIEELTVFIKVNIESLIAYSNSIPLKVNMKDNTNIDKIKTNTVKKYL